MFIIVWKKKRNFASDKLNNVITLLNKTDIS